jgi:hypothetical protein
LVEKTKDLQHNKNYYKVVSIITGVDPGGGAHLAHASSKIGKNMIFWHKIFHMKYPKQFRVSLCSAQFL